MSDTDSTTRSERHPRSVITLAVLGLIGTALGSVVGLTYDVVVREGDTAALVSVASIAVGALATLAGAATRRHDDSTEKPPDQ